MALEIFLGLVILLGALYYFIDREIYFYEGAHLGVRLQRWLYDRWAAQYDRGKQASQAQDEALLSQPILEKMAVRPALLVLDLATGTGRLPLALFNNPDFRGTIIALDISPKMLSLAGEKLAPFKPRLKLIQYLTLPLPFPDDSFDIVCCLEALEVMPAMEAPLKELQRLLRPGGLLVTSRGTEASGRKAKIRSVENFTGLLIHNGFEQVEILPWWKYFDRVFARKPGALIPAATQSLTDILQCKVCGKTDWNETAPALVCQHCGTHYLYAKDGLLVFEAQSD